MTTINFLLLDAARMQGEIHHARELNLDHTCLYEGDSERFLSAVAPWLFSLPPESPFTTWISEKAGGQNWGVLLRSREGPVQLYKHLRQFLITEGEDGREMYFRYYDPRVLRAFLPTCETEQLRAFFGPIDAFVAEDASGRVMEYHMNPEGDLEVTETGKDLATFFRTGQSTLVDRVSEEAPVKPKKNWDFGY